MDDIQKAQLRRASKKFSAAGFEMRTDVHVGPMSNLWLYSCSYRAGKVMPRMMTQVTANVRGEMLSRSGLMAEELELKDGGATTKFKPNDVDELAVIIREYDKLKGSADEASRQLLALVLARYVVITKTWEISKQYDHQAGIHIIVIDIQGADGSTDILPALIPQRDIVLDPEDIEFVVRARVDHHTSARGRGR